MIESKWLVQDIDTSQRKLLIVLHFFLVCTTCYCLLSSSLLMRLPLLNTIIYILNPSVPGTSQYFLPPWPAQIGQCRCHCNQINSWLSNKDVDQRYLIVFTLSTRQCQQRPQRDHGPIYHHTIYISKREITLPLREGFFHSPLIFLLD